MKKFHFLLFSILLAACQPAANENSETATYSTLRGETMGTTYSIIYSSEEVIQGAVDSLLKEINSQVNTYDPTSLISQYNTTESIAIPKGSANHFEINYAKAKTVFAKTNGLFDPTVMPLVSYWGFGKEKLKVEHADDAKIKEMLTYVGFNKTILETGEEGKTHFYKKKNPKVQLDFSALAKGYAVDKMCEMLQNKGINNYMVEIGGETKTNGVNAQGKVWTLGIVTPDAEANPRSDFQAIIQLDGKAIATSGNYRNFYEVNGKKYAHTINPQTGYSEMNSLLSASVIMDDCMSADAFATGFMAMGLEKAFELAEKEANIEALFIYDDNGAMKVKYTSGMQKYLLE